MGVEENERMCCSQLFCIVASQQEGSKFDSQAWGTSGWSFHVHMRQMLMLSLKSIQPFEEELESEEKTVLQSTSGQSYSSSK